MAFTVQTATPTAGANAYVSVDDFRAYHLERGRDLAAYADAACEAAIVLATQYLDIRFEYVGYRQEADQTTEWPRRNAWNSRGDAVLGVPSAVVNATSEYAHRALTSTLLADPSRDASGLVLKSRSETVGPISERVEFSEYAGFQMPEYPLADRLLISQGLVANGQHRRSGLTSGYVGRG